MFTVSLQLAGVTSDEGSDASFHRLRLQVRKPRKGEGHPKRGEMLGRLAVDVWLLLKLKISIPIRTPGFIEAQFVSLLQDNTHSSRGQ